MFFILSKIFAFLFMPLTWVFALLLLALFTTKKRQFVIAGLATMYFFCNSFILDEVMRLWELPAVKQETLKPPYDVAIVLGGGMATYDKEFDRINFVDNTDRFLQAVDLYKKGIVKKLLITGGDAAILDNNGKESELIASYLHRIGIPEEDIIVESQSANTYQNALFCGVILNRLYPKGKFLLITSASHLRRSTRCFDKQGVFAMPYATDRHSGPRKYYFDHLIMPKAENLMRWNELIHEWVGMVSYRFAGYI